MNLNRAYAVFLRQYYLLKSGMTRIIPLFAWVGIDMILWGIHGEVSKFGRWTCW